MWARDHPRPMVVRATLRIRHHGCVTEKLQGETTLTQVSGERGWDLFVLSAPDAAALEEGLRIAESNGERAQILSRTPEAIVFKGRNPPGGIVQEIRGSACWIQWPIVYRDGLELFTIGAPDREALRTLLPSLAKHGDVRLERVVEETADGLGGTAPVGDLVADLTARQLAALRLASARGYYASPSAVSSDDLASEFGVAPSTMREHLRKAEAAVIARLAEMLEERPAMAKSARRTPGRPKRR